MLLLNALAYRWSSLPKPMGDVFEVFQGMAVRTKHLQVLLGIIVPVSVSMMNAQDLRLSVIMASRALQKHLTPAHRFTHGRVCGRPGFVAALVDTGFAAIFPVFGRRASEFFATMPARVLHAALEVLRLVVALPGTVFRLIRPRAYMGEALSAHRAVSVDLHRGSQRLAPPGAVSCGRKHVGRDGKHCLAVSALDVDGHMEAAFAT